MTSKLVLMGCGALMALTQAAHGADAEALSKFLNESLPDNSGLKVVASPCALKTHGRFQPRNAPLGDETGERTLGITNTLGKIDFATAAYERKVDAVRISAEWFEEHQGPMRVAAMHPIMARSDPAWKALPAGEKHVLEMQKTEDLIEEAEAGLYGPDVAANLFVMRTFDRGGALQDIILRVRDRFDLPVKPGAEQAVLDALIEWRAETCIGN